MIGKHDYNHSYYENNRPYKSLLLKNQQTVKNVTAD